eukprot:TRINITY_DN12710_c0_g1_i1.p1 TRINITY_DN12710_c0_g1~~TRINITY_DN12710_c0_g1_i1.p1  ORF type:complete len:260 (-),score=66.84 TRINITY_DN12710_c0_g1_i1:171-890(-)
MCIRDSFNFGGRTEEADAISALNSGIDPLAGNPTKGLQARKRNAKFSESRTTANGDTVFIPKDILKLIEEFKVDFLPVGVEFDEFDLPRASTAEGGFKISEEVGEPRSASMARNRAKVARGASGTRLKVLDKSDVMEGEVRTTSGRTLSILQPSKNVKMSEVQMRTQFKIRKMLHRNEGLPPPPPLAPLAPASAVFGPGNSGVFTRRIIPVKADRKTPEMRLGRLASPLTPSQVAPSQN